MRLAQQDQLLICCVLCLAGKSSLLQAILNKMVVAKGSVAVGGQIAYVPQVPSGTEFVPERKHSVWHGV